VQAIDARATGPEHALRISLLTQLLRRGRWLAGTAMSALGWPLQIVALLFAPLEVVQPALAVGLLVLLALGERMLDERPGRRELAATCAIVAGVAGLAAFAPARTTHDVGGISLVVVLALLGAAALAPFVAQLLRRAVANLAMIGAGLAFAWGALATKLVSDAASAGRWLSVVGWGAGAILASIVGLTEEMSALQKRPAILVAPVVFVAQTFVPIMLAPLVFHESFLRTTASGIPLLLCLVILLAGATVLARSPALLAISQRREREAAAAGAPPLGVAAAQAGVASDDVRRQREPGESRVASELAEPAQSPQRRGGRAREP
jgi:hypothetical protein